MLLILLSTFVSIAFIVMVIYWLMFRPVSATAQRLHELDDSPHHAVVQSIEANTMETLAQRWPSQLIVSSHHPRLMQLSSRSN
jgi:hypothetical protein